MDWEGARDVKSDGSVVVTSMCRFCAPECGILVTIRGKDVLAIRGDPEHPLSRGYMCSKGRSLGRAHHDIRRLDQFSIGRDKSRTTAPAAQVLGDLANRLRRIRDESGPDAVAFYIGTATQLDSAGSALARRLASELGTRSLYTTNTVDTVGKRTANRLMMGGADLPCLVNFEETKLLGLFGINPVVSHGHTWSFPDPVRLMRELTGRGEVWVFDPRKSEVASLATHHLQLYPGSDHALLAFTIRELLESGADEQYLSEHSIGVDALRIAVEPFTLSVAAQRTRLERKELSHFVSAIRENGKIAALSGTGLSFSVAPSVAEWLLMSLHVITGSIEQPGGLWWHKGFWSKADTTKPLVNEPEDGPPSRPELKSWLPGQRIAAALADEIAAGHVRALIVLGGNVQTAFPNYERVREALANIEVLAVADVIDGEMSALATHVLACKGQLECAAVNSTANAQPAQFGHVAPAVLPSEGDRQSLWWILAELGRRLDVDILPQGVTSSGTDLDVLRGLYPSPVVPFEEVLAARSGLLVSRKFEPWFTDTVLPDGRWQLAPSLLVDQLKELKDPEDGLLLIPRRQKHHLNNTLSDLASGTTSDMAYLYINRHDAEDLGITSGSEVEVSSGTGSLIATASVDDSIGRGVVSLPHGYDSTNVNLLTSDKDQLDPVSGMPLFSCLRVVIRKI